MKKVIFLVVFLLSLYSVKAQLSHVDLNFGFHQPVLLSKTNTVNSMSTYLNQSANQAEIYDEVFKVDPGLIFSMELNFRVADRFDFLLSGGVSNLSFERESRYIRRTSIDTADVEFFERNLSLVRNWYANLAPGVNFNLSEQWQLSVLIPMSIMLTSTDETQRYTQTTRFSENTDPVEEAEFTVVDIDESGAKFNSFQPSVQFRARYQINDVFGAFLSYQYNLAALYDVDAQVAGAINTNYISGGISYRIRYN